MAITVRVSANVNGALKKLTKMGVDYEAAANNIMRREAIRGVKDVKSRWPVKSGDSRKGWGLLTLGPLRYAWLNTVPYVRFIRRKGAKAGRFAKQKGKGSVLFLVGGSEAKNTKRRIVRQLRKLAKDLKNG